MKRRRDERGASRRGTTTPDKRYNAGASWVESDVTFEGSQNGTFATTLSKPTL